MEVGARTDTDQGTSPLSSEASTCHLAAGGPESPGGAAPLQRLQFSTLAEQCQEVFQYLSEQWVDGTLLLVTFPQSKDGSVAIGSEQFVVGLHKAITDQDARLSSALEARQVLQEWLQHINECLQQTSQDLAKSNAKLNDHNRALSDSHL